jgi:hypothetical protein
MEYSLEISSLCFYFAFMIGKRVEMCNECRNEVLRFGENVSTFLAYFMKKPKHHINRLRQNRTLHSITIIVLWIAVLASIPHGDIEADHTSSRIQKFLPADSMPIASPSDHLKVSTEYGEFSVVVLDAADIENHLHTTTILEQCSSDHARAFTSVLLYTQITSSFL